MKRSAIGVFNGNWKNQWAREFGEPFEPLPPDHEWSHYWSVKRRSKSRRKKWVHVAYFQLTKAEMAEVWRKYFMDGEHRLVHCFSYEPKIPA